ncbi:hypothetical protein AQUCO_00300002v1 [Aquilegia coerulea]|uniref:Transmembrane protein n=1 Tax=Aquilegia coerulea TaxID=218851 RepID=A0A2G5EWP7_AQUCA|nr:hypothetical protein AQUCO_00300002v1 [Aquilegia coerulea]
MAYGRRSQTSSILEVFSLNPLPYPVILILAVMFIFLGTSYYFSYESAVEETEESLSLVLKATPVILLIMVRWLSSMENTDWLFPRSSPYDRRRATNNNRPSEGTSPFVVAVVIIVLLVMVSYQSSFHDSWFG